MDNIFNNKENTSMYDTIYNQLYKPDNIQHNINSTYTKEDNIYDTIYNNLKSSDLKSSDLKSTNTNLSCKNGKVFLNKVIQQNDKKTPPLLTKSEEAIDLLPNILLNKSKLNVLKVKNELNDDIFNLKELLADLNIQSYSNWEDIQLKYNTIFNKYIKNHYLQFDTFKTLSEKKELVKKLIIINNLINNIKDVMYNILIKNKDIIKLLLGLLNDFNNKTEVQIIKKKIHSLLDIINYFVKSIHYNGKNILICNEDTIIRLEYICNSEEYIEIILPTMNNYNMINNFCEFNNLNLDTIYELLLKIKNNNHELLLIDGRLDNNKDKLVSIINNLKRERIELSKSLSIIKNNLIVYLMLKH